MSITGIRVYAALAAVTSLLWLAGCGGNGTNVCPLAAASCCPPGVACVAPQYLYTAGLHPQVSSFRVDPATGGLGASMSTSGPPATLGMAALNGSFLYVSNPVSMTTGSIDAWSIDLTTGILTVVPGSPFSLGPLTAAGGLAANNTAQVLYVADAGTIDALKIGANGALSAIPGSPFAAGSNVFLTVHASNRFLFASDSTPPGNVLAYTIDSAGELTPAPGSPFATIPNHVGSTNPSQILVDSTGKFVYVGLLNTNQVAAFSIVTATGALNPVPGSPFRAGNGPVALTTASKFLYVANGLDGTISGYSIDPGTGSLTVLAGSPFAIRGGAMTTDPIGNFLYVSGPTGILVFKIDANTGSLTQIGSAVPSTGASVVTYVR